MYTTTCFGGRHYLFGFPSPPLTITPTKNVPDKVMNHSCLFFFFSLLCRRQSHVTMGAIGLGTHHHCRCKPATVAAQFRQLCFLQVRRGWRFGSAADEDENGVVGVDLQWVDEGCRA
ncbi:hypothetical protein M0R45_026853 [Rubus argutus]|uniref:Uncharacterized protein n=1 Tax=Rubus argutus TaxID=59490 RepID=A0AAW1X0E4_RUBAR